LLFNFLFIVANNGLTFVYAQQLRYGPKTTPLVLAPAKFRSELYEGDTDSENLHDWHFQKLISHMATIQKVEKAAQQADAALAQFQATMESLRKEKEENRYVHRPRKKTSVSERKLTDCPTEQRS